MLVLTRKVGERIWVGDQIAITIVKVTPGGVRVGIEAPPEFAVVREELRKQLLNQPGIESVVPHEDPTAS